MRHIGVKACSIFVKFHASREKYVYNQIDKKNSKNFAGYIAHSGTNSA
jgi:hypothetical protein